ncbi:response regulator transcription factor [Natronosporangium hydrolyticum]|uniref:Response regulator transcription factor n=1 Tax=Natronosporangium hydrolyticum TaxID=2811111 RepID=A0A895YIV8_9ACTN|nr:response regulator transcription factor [Natronosporangium hydrolyticum]QSB14526.1 response regulator transcription factor [Natronosporangium hydrolyticum]
MEILLLVSNRAGEPASVLPSLDLLPHSVRTAPRDVRALVAGPSADAVLVDARSELADARATCRVLEATGLGVPLLAVVTEAGLITVNADWGIDDVLLTTAGPAEVEARLRLVTGRHSSAVAGASGLIRAGELTIDPDTYAAKLRGHPLDLTYKEFELLRFLAQHPGRVFTRDQLLREVWGYDYFGGTRTVDVHVRRLRAKLGAEYESMIGTVRQVGYKFVLPPTRPLPEAATATADEVGSDERAALESANQPG